MVSTVCVIRCLALALLRLTHWKGAKMLVYAILGLVSALSVYNYWAQSCDIKLLNQLGINQQAIIKTLNQLVQGDIALSQEPALTGESVQSKKRPVGFKFPQDQEPKKKIGFRIGE